MNRIGIAPAILLCLSMMLGTATVAAESVFVNGNTLLEAFEECDQYHAGSENHDDYFSCGYAKAYILGIFDSYETGTDQLGTQRVICLPDVTLDEVTNIVREFLDGNSSMLHNSASSLVLTALAGAYPCS